MVDGNIVAQKKMSKYDAQFYDIKEREESIMKWLVENGFWFFIGIVTELSPRYNSKNKSPHLHAEHNGEFVFVNLEGYIVEGS